MALVSHTADDLATLPTRLNAGERQVYDVLAALPDEWSVHVQPRLTMAQPDFVVVHDDLGACALEVKDWNPAVHRVVDGRVEVRDRRGWQGASGQNPLQQVLGYRWTIFDRFFANPGLHHDAVAAVRGLVVLPRFSDAEAEALRLGLRGGQSASATFCGMEGLRAGLEHLLIEKASGRRSWCKPCCERLRVHLREPELVREQSLPLTLSDEARSVERNRGRAEIRRVRGTAGSGKSLALAARAATLAAEGKSVLVLCFNITLAHYLRDLAARHSRTTGASIRSIHFTHFHGFCQHVVETHDPDLRWGRDLKRLVATAEDICRKDAERRFDAVLIDEGQDFNADWWNFLRNHVRRARGEMLLVADVAQDLYEAAAWTEEQSMQGCGFRGPWATLQHSYRLPPDVIPIAREFAERFLPSDDYQLPIVPEDHPGLKDASEPTIRSWRNLSPTDDLATQVVLEIDRLVRSVPNLAIGDIAFLTETHSVGLQVANSLRSKDFDVAHVFTKDEGRERQSSKKRFWGGSPGIKGCTIHSFKGWEARAIVLVISRSKSARRLAYVALTRVKGDPARRSAAVSVLNTDPELDAFRSRFMREVSLTEAAGLGGQRSFDVT